MWELVNQPLSPMATLLLVGGCLAVIFLAIRLGHGQSRKVSARFLAEHPDAATLYLYAEDLPSNSAELEGIRGTFSKVFDPRTVPGAKIQKGAACHVLPGTVELNGTITWTKDYHVARKHGRMGAHFTFEAAPGGAYAAVFHTGSSTTKIVSLDNA